MNLLEERFAAPGIVQLVMNQPHKKNALNASMREALADRFTALADDPAVSAIILTGAGGDFSAGGDIQGLMKVDKVDFRRYLKRGHRLILKLWNFEKPTVAAIEGVGVGGGLALAMCCDFIVMGRSATIGFSFLKIGFVPDWGTLYTVTHRVGIARARELFLSAGLIDGARARDIGLVDLVVEDDQVQPAAVAAAQRLSQHSRRAYAYTKRLLQNLPATLEQTLEFETSAQENCFKSEDFLTGVAPYLKSDRS